jgi:hypothetical protein
MNGKRYRLPIAQLLLTALAIPAGLNAQVTGDVPITILQTTDLHHHANGAEHVGLDLNAVSAMGVTGAYARISSYVSYVRANAGHPVILVDSGDWTMGTFYDLTLASRPLALSFHDLMGYDCVTLGNHEFDYSPASLAQMLKAAQSSFGFHIFRRESSLRSGYPQRHLESFTNTRFSRTREPPWGASALSPSPLSAGGSFRAVRRRGYSRARPSFGSSRAVAPGLFECGAGEHSEAVYGFI